MAEEKTFETKVKKFLASRNAWYLKYWGGGGFTKSGIPDLLICCNSRFIAAELKASKGKPKDIQIKKLKEIDDAGGFAILLYPDQFTLFQNLIDCIVAGDEENSQINYKLIKERWVSQWESLKNQDSMSENSY